MRTAQAGTVSAVLLPDGRWYEVEGLPAGDTMRLPDGEVGRVVELQEPDGTTVLVRAASIVAWRLAEAPAEVTVQPLAQESGSGFPPVRPGVGGSPVMPAVSDLETARQASLTANLRG